MNSAMIIICLALVGAIIVGLLASHGRKMNLEQWSVGGRTFGTVFVFVLMAGEIYTTFTFLGASGFAYGKGGAVLYIMTYTCLAFVSSYWLLPPIWRYAKQHNLITQPDFFARVYDSPAVGFIVAIVGLVALIPYLILQFKGLGIIVEIASYGAISTQTAVIIGAVAMSIYVVVSGVHGSAWNATIKDCTILLVCAFLGLYLPYHYYGSVGEMFASIEKAKSGFLALPQVGENPMWYCTTIAISALGLYMWPHTFASIYTSKSERIFRKNAVVMPLYSLVMLFSMLVGFTAVLKVPGLTGGQIDLALLRLSIATFDPWFVGVIGAAGVLTALVPGSMMLIAASTLFANNIYRKLMPETEGRSVSRIAKLAAPLIAMVAVYFTINGGNSIVALLIMGYSIVTQLFPPLVASLLPNNPVTKQGAIAGILVGVATVAVVVTTKTSIATLFPGASPLVAGINTGFIALTLNVATMIVVSAFSRVPQPRLASSAE
ncbi:sodium:solute symporter [Bradyrhizobium sp. S69]|uniref:sodium:solute symporter family protein n=1 Tax=Bradyrhizobium sp. S69 TaxID=1641856 RepID=UPI00131CF403|nr:sodium:solute symporter [Bradyrhizobium sp. S69]